MPGPRRSLRSSARSACVAAVLLAPPPPALTAQAWYGTAEVGATRVSQRAVPRTDAITAGLGFRHDRPRFVFAAAGGVTLAGEDRSTTQGLVTASLLGRARGPMRWEVGGALTAFDNGGLPLTRGAYVLAREHFAIRGFRGWAGAALGGVEDLNRWSPTRSVEFGSWFTTPSIRLSATAVLIDTRSEPYGPEGQLVTDAVTYADATVGARWVVRQRAELDARTGIRLISRGALTPTGRGTRPFAGIDAALWLTPRVALVAAMGRQLSDLSRGTPDTRFAALGLRFSVRDPGPAPPPARRPPTRVGEGLRLTLASDAAGKPQLVAAAPDAVLVELAASFTDWEPVPLVKRGDRWELDRPIPSGAHRVLIRVDGGPWLVPANLPAAGDDFGGAVGIITIP